MFLWSRKEMEDILLQLEARGQLFERCRFCRRKDQSKALKSEGSSEQSEICQGSGG